MRVICVGPTGEELFTARPSSVDPIGFGCVGARSHYGVGFLI